MIRQLASCLLLVCLAGNIDAAERPNILFIMADDHACNAISAYGGRLAKVAPTPNIDRIAKEGMRLNKCYVTNSICTPSRAVIMSGQHSNVNSVRTLNDAFPGPKSGTPNVADILRRSGYETVLFGKWHLRSEPWGFDYWNVGPGQGFYHNPVFVSSTDDIAYSQNLARKIPRTDGYYTDLVTDYALDWLKKREDGEKPFFMMLHHKAPHGKWEPPARHKKYLADVKIPEPDSLWEDFSHRSEATRKMGTSITSRLAPRRTMVADVQKANWPAGSVDLSGLTDKEQGKAAYQKYLHDYLGCVKAVDENVGRVLDYLDKSGLAKNTIVVYTSDQGMFLGEHDYFDKRWIYEECFKMPFLIRLPGTVPAGSVNDTHLCSNLDFAQTFLDFADVSEAPEIAKMQGRSLREIVSGQAPKDWRDAVYYRYWMHLAHHHIPGHYGVRDDRYKLAFFYGLPLDASLGRGKFGPSTPGWELYDLEDDPHELNNVYEEPRYAAVVERLKKRLTQLKKQYGDTDDRYPALMRRRSGLFDMSAIRDPSTLKVEVLQDWHHVDGEVPTRQKLITIHVGDVFPGEPYRMPVRMVVPADRKAKGFHLTGGNRPDNLNRDTRLQPIDRELIQGGVGLVYTVVQVLKASGLGELGRRSEERFSKTLNPHDKIQYWAWPATMMRAVTAAYSEQEYFAVGKVAMSGGSKNGATPSLAIIHDERMTAVFASVSPIWDSPLRLCEPEAWDELQRVAGPFRHPFLGGHYGPIFNRAALAAGHPWKDLQKLARNISDSVFISRNLEQLRARNVDMLFHPGTHDFVAFDMAWGGQHHPTIPIYLRANSGHGQRKGHPAAERMEQNRSAFLLEHFFDEVDPLLESPEVQHALDEGKLNVTVRFKRGSGEETGRIFWIYDRASDGSPGYLRKLIPDNNWAEMQHDKQRGVWTATVTLEPTAKRIDLFTNHRKSVRYGDKQYSTYISSPYTRVGLTAGKTVGREN
jgi:arylsulfatase A-like enzyme